MVRLERLDPDPAQPGESGRSTDLRYRHSMNLGRDGTTATNYEEGVLALGVGGLLRADSEAVLVETEEPVHRDSGIKGRRLEYAIQYGPNSRKSSFNLLFCF